MASLSRIIIYPIKSLDGVELDTARLLPSGGLEGDRRFAMRDAAGQLLTGKRTPAVHRLRAQFDLARRRVYLGARDARDATGFDWDADRPALETWLSDFFGAPIRLSENRQQGFPDDLAAAGPTVIGDSTLAEVASWFPDLQRDDVRRRFRANLELRTDQPFWEDRLVAPDSTPRPFAIGAVAFQGINPCQRCVVPSRAPDTGDVWPGFAARFAQQRARRLPPWAPRARFDHFYRLAVNTRRADTAEECVTVGDAVTLPADDR